MIYAKIQSQGILGSGEEDLLKVVFFFFFFLSYIDLAAIGLRLRPF